MLVITRYEGESIFIHEDIKVIILGIKNSRVRVGIEAPKEILILREELRLSRQQYDKKGNFQ